MYTFSQRLREKLLEHGVSVKYADPTEISFLKVLTLAFTTITPLKDQLESYRDGKYPCTKRAEYPNTAQELESNEVSSKKININLIKRENDNATTVALLELKIKNHCLIIKTCAVEPAYQKQGFGKLLMEIAREVAIQHHCPEIHVLSVSDAISFYNKYGLTAKKADKPSYLTLFTNKSRPQPGRAYEAEDALEIHAKQFHSSF